MNRDDPKYRPSIFDCADLDAAKRIIITTMTAEENEYLWRVDTPLMAQLLVDHLKLSPASRVLDFGCGIGRIARALIEKVGCEIVGIDISASMRQMAQDYVASPRFSALEPARLAEDGLPGSFGAAYAIRVIQHAEWPGEELTRIAGSLRPDGRFALVNSYERCVPTTHGWATDGVDVLALANEIFRLDATFDHPVHVYRPETAQAIFLRGFSATCLERVVSGRGRGLFPWGRSLGLALARGGRAPIRPCSPRPCSASQSSPRSCRLPP